MSEYFTYIIRSNNKTDAYDSNNCFIELSGLPSNFQEFECEVVNFYVGTTNDTLATSVVEIRAYNLNFKNGFDTKNKTLQTLAFTTPNNSSPSIGLKFNIGNFNNQRVNFQLYDEYSNLLLDNGDLNYTDPWILVLKMRGIKT